MVDVNTLGSPVIICNASKVYRHPRTPFVLASFFLLKVLFGGYEFIYFVGVYGKGFPVDSCSCIYLMFLIPLF